MTGGKWRAKKPWEYAVAGEWPYAVMDGFLPAQVGQAVARALAEAMERQKFSANSLAAASGVNRQVISNVLAGTVWPDLMTMVRLEETLGEMLWPRHLDWPADESGVRQQPLPPQKRRDLD
ncbi:helix-turn-helix domain-containing protein [Streptomyces sp. NPDC051563]|uniref:helix-turn-helix domain-containing protein n=1 Tax=Streptomyces sp. NPDC051563 TaxID=3365659 RepID=UPI0037AFBDE4